MEKDKDHILGEAFICAKGLGAAGKFTEALACLDDLGDDIKQMDDFFLSRGTINFLANDYSGAAADFKRASEINPQGVLAWNLRGRMELELGNPGKAIDYFSRSNQLRPNAEALTFRGMIFFEMGDCENAIIDLDLAIRLEPKNIFSQYQMGLAVFQLGEFKIALGIFDFIIEIDPKNSHAYGERGLVKIQLGDSAGAIADFAQALALNPNVSPLVTEKYEELLGNAKAEVNISRG